MPNLKNKKVIKDQQGQRKYPGRVTKIQGNTMATTGYGDIPLYVVPNVGNPMVVPANSGNRVFPGASSFTEYPIAKNGGWLEKYQDGGKKLDTSNWKQSSIDSLNLYNKGNEMVKWAKNNPNFTTIEHNKKDIELNIKYPVSSMALGNIDAKNWADINSTKSGNYGVPLYDKPVGVQKKLIKPKVKPKLDTSNWEQSSLDSLKRYNKNEAMWKGWQPLTPSNAQQINTTYAPDRVYKKRDNPNLPGYDVVYKDVVKKPVGVQKKKVEPVKELVKTETVNLTEPIKTQAINIPNPIDENRREVNFGQKYQTFNYPGQHGYSGNDVTSKYFDPTTKNEIDVSKSFDLKGNYNPVYLEQKKYGGWLEQYGDGGETDQNPLLKSKTLLLEGNDENPQDLGPDANRSGFGINDKKIHISDNRKIRATTGKKINPNVALKTGDYDENVIDSLIKYSIKYNINPNRVLAQGLAESTFGKKDSQNIGHLKHFYKNESPYPQMMEAILEGDRLAKTNKNKKTTREEIIQGYNGYGKLFPETEKDYHGGNSKGFYEVPFGKEGYLDMDKNPLYGIEIKDLMDNVIGKDAQIQYKILNSKNPIKKEFYNPNNVKIPYRRKDFKYGGIVKALQNKQDNSQWLNKYK